MESLFLGLGSNINAESNLRQCAEYLRALWPNISFSRVYTTKAQDEETQEDFLNAVARIEDIHSSAEEIMERTRTIESRLRKNPPYPKGPRTIDIDILLLGNTVQQIEDVHIPHPRLHRRRFVLEPLCELLDPETMHPQQEETLASLLEKTLDQSCTITDIVL